MKKYGSSGNSLKIARDVK